MKALTARQQDTLREVANLGSAQAASMLARLVGDVGVLVDVPVVMAALPHQLAWLFGGADLKVLAATFSVDGAVPAKLWWVLRADDAGRLGQRLLARPGVSGPLSSSAHEALAEAANIVASACVSTVGNVLKTALLPSTPTVTEGPVAELLERFAGTGERTVLSATFTSTNSPTFCGWLLVMFDEPATSSVLERLRA